jgi:nicotinate phosphoribosyltransferase
MAFDSEREAFEAYHKVFPDTTVLLVDTYDTIEGTKAAAQIGADLKGVRLDSGNIAGLSKRVRKVLDDAGLRDAKIIASGDLNEYKISDILSSGGSVDTFGVGTEMVTSKDAPALSAVYKLVERSRGGAPRPVIKLSEKKQTLPGAKQVYRFRREDGLFQQDLLTHMDEPAPQGAEPLLRPIMRGGKLVYDLPSIDQIRSRARAQIDSLPPGLKTITPGSDFLVHHSEHLLNLQAEAASRLPKGRKEARTCKRAKSRS